MADVSCILPSNTVLDETGIEDVVHDWIVGCTGFSNTNVVPAFQEDSINIPDGDWCAFWFHVEPDLDSYIRQSVDGTQMMETHHEFLHFRVSFYGPNSRTKAQFFRDVARIPSNSNLLKNNDMRIYMFGDRMVTLNEKVKDKWYKRTDLPLTLKRSVTRIYAKDNVASAEFILDNEMYTTTIEVKQ